MRTARFTGRNENGTRAPYHVEIFDDYQDLLSAIERRQPEADETYRIAAMGDRDDWSGSASYEDAKRMLLNGWDKPVEGLKERFKGVEKAFRERLVSRVTLSPVGFAPCVPNMLMGLPNSMLNVRKVRTSDSKVLNFIINISRACHFSASEIEGLMGKQLADIAALEAQGYRCRISVCFSPTDGHAREGERERPISVGMLKIKDEGQPFEIKSVAFPLVHAAMLRRLMFAWAGTLQSKESVGLRNAADSGLGIGFEHWSDGRREAFEKSLTENLGMGKAMIVGVRDSIRDKIAKK